MRESWVTVRHDTRPFVVYWNNIPAPYMVERFNALADRGSLEFEAWFNERTAPGRSWAVDESEWRFRHRYLPRLNLAGYSLHWPTPLLGRLPDALVSLYADPVFVSGWLLARLRGARTAFWCVATSDSWVRRTSLKNGIKRALFSRVDATLSAGEESRAFAIGFGTPPDRALILPHAIDVAHYAEGRERAWPQREAFRDGLGLAGTTFIYVGRLWSKKGVLALVAAFERVQRDSEAPVSLLFVGDGPDVDRVMRECSVRGLRNVVFAGFQPKDELPGYYAAADVFVFPTLGDPYGLVVDEAMASSLPVVATSAAGDIRERVTDGENGFIVPPGDDVRLAEAMSRISSDQALRLRMGKASKRRVMGRTPARWAEAFEGIVEHLLR